MSDGQETALRVHRHVDLPLVTITLNRPASRNAFDAALIDELHAAVVGLEEDVRVLVLTGAGSSFCAGADLRYMRASRTWSAAENTADAQRLMRLFRALNEAPCVVIGRINGAAIGGGAGLVACCDVVVAHERATFGFAEVRLGIVPAVISPFVLAKIGAPQARRYFLTGERFSAQRARDIGLVHEVALGEKGENAGLDLLVQGMVDEALWAAPGAVAVAKTLIREVADSPCDTPLLHRMAATIAELRSGEEAQQGFAAFLERRPPPWVRGP